MRTIVLSVFAVALFLMDGVSSADTIFLQNGNKIEGKIVGVTSEFVVIQTSKGEILIRKVTIESADPPLSQIERGIQPKPAIHPEALVSVRPQEPSLTLQAPKRKYPLDAKTVVIGGTFSINYHLSEAPAYTEILFAPNILAFMVPHFALGADMSLSHDSQSEITSIGIGPKALIAFGSKESKTYPYIGIGFNYLHSNQRDYYYESFSSASDFCFKFGGGVNVMLASHLGMPIEIVYILQKEKHQPRLYWWGELTSREETRRSLIVGVGLVGFLY
ncbi:MAG: hypothetical protein AB1393_13070 [Candidatus Edwardsbacteria bacterium]